MFDTEIPSTLPSNSARTGDSEPEKSRGSEFWESDRGRRVITYLHAWGLVVRGRIDTGDDSYVPPMESDGLSAGTNRSSPSNVSDVLLRFMDIDRVRPLMSRGQQRLSYWCFVTSQTTKHMHRPVFRDGTFGEWAHGPEPREDSPLIASYENDIRTVFEWQWWKYPATETEKQYWRDWGVWPAEILERELLQVGRLVAKELNL